MSVFKQFLQVVIIAVPLLMLNGCFPTDSDDENQNNNPIGADTSITSKDKPEDLPTDINTSANTSDEGIDSMFNLLISRAKEIENVSSPVELYALDFVSLRQGFGAAVNEHPNHVQANVGFIVSSVLSLNTNTDLQKVIDSIEVYINDMDAYYYSESVEPILLKRRASRKSSAPKTGFLSKTFARRGIISAGQVLFAKTPQVLMAQTNQPSFPRFLTVSYIQNIIETGVIPRLNEVVAATQRLQALDQMSLLITIDGETWEIDVGDIFILEGMTRAARAGFAMICIYNYDLYSNGSNTMSWIDSYIDEISSMDYISTVTYSLSGDTIIRECFDDMTGITSPYMDIYQENIERSNFLSIRKNYHQAVYSDLQKVPVLIKAGITAMKSEDDNQDDDLIPSTDIFEMSSEMSELSREMLEEGFSTALAAKFESPEALMDFIFSVLTNPYTFDETIDGIHVKITVDLSKFFTNPANSLKDYWPLYRIPTGDDRYVTYTGSEYIDEWLTNTIYVFSDSYDSVLIDIPASEIDSVGSSTLNPGTKIYYLKNACSYTKDKYIVRTAVAMQLIDDKDNPIDFYDVLYDDEITVQALSTVFPYFNDYTFKGIFPDMKTRRDWIDFFSVFIE